MLRNSLKPVIVLIVLMVGSLCAESPFNVDVFCGWNGYYRPMEWTPVEVGITASLNDTFQGKVMLSAQQDGLNTMNITQELTLMPDFPKRLPLVTKFAFAADKCRLRIIDDKDRTRWDNEFELWNVSRRNRFLSVVNDNDLFIGLIGSQRFGLTRLAKQSICKSARGTGKVFVANRLQRMTPWDWTGFASLDLLMLYDPVWNTFSIEQLNAIAQYVSNGGSLLVVLAGKPLPAENPIGRLLPFEIQNKKRLTLGVRTLQSWQLNAAEPQDVNAWPIKPKPGAGFFQTETNDVNQCVFAVGCVGFGRVGVLAFDPSELTDRHRSNASRFWANRIARVLDYDRPGTINSANNETVTLKSAVVVPQGVRPMPNSSALTGDLTHADNVQCGIQLTIKGLEPGKYTMTSYHNNPSTRHSNIDVYVNDKLSSSNNPQTSVNSDARASKITTVFEVADTGNVVIEFRPVRESQFNRRAVLCGFQLTRSSASPGSDSKSADVIAVDFGANGQAIAPGFIGLGYSIGARMKIATFDSSNGLPEGVNIALKATADDNLQFQPTMNLVAPRQRPGRRPTNKVETITASALHRSIEYVENADTYPHNSQNERFFQTSIGQVAGTAVMEYLYNIPEMKPLSIWWVIIILTVLAVLLGPVDYKILKRLDRLPLTWLTCAIWIALFTGGAYYGVQELRGGEMQLRAVSVVDGIQDSDYQWSTTYLGMFAPRSRNYQLSGLKPDQWWSATSPTEESIWSGRRDSGSRNIYCLQQDGYNRLYSAPINIWTVQCLVNEEPQSQLPLQVELSRSGDEVTLKITNQASCPVESGYVLFGDDRSMNFGSVAPGATKKLKDRLTRSRRWDMQLRQDGRYGVLRAQLSGPFRPEKAFFAQGILPRTRAISDYLKHGAAVVCAEYDNAPVSCKVKNYPCSYTHVRMVRLVVFPKTGDANDRTHLE